MDDFEFKPLTEGLGFHKKIIDLKEEQSPSMSSLTSLTTGGILPKSRPQTTASTNLSREPINKTPQQKPAPAKPLVQSPQPAPWTPALSGKTFEESIKKTQKPGWVTVAASWPASIFDSTMILGMTLLFSAVVFAVTGISLSDLGDMLRNDPAAQLASVVLLICVLEIYAVGCRTFFSMTLGEWAFDYRLGTPEDQQTTVYPVMVAWRALLITLTGFVVLPAISSIVKRDVTGLLTGVDLYAEKR